MAQMNRMKIHSLLLLSLFIGSTWARNPRRLEARESQVKLDRFLSAVAQRRGGISSRQVNRGQVEPATAAQTPVGDTQFLPQLPTGLMAQIVSIEVQCQKESMSIKIEFSLPFNGIIYSKGYFSDSSCQYIAANSGKSIYEFTVFLDRCGTQFIDQFSQGGQAYLENTIIIQNEPSFQEIWDTARHIRCLWTGQFEKTVTSSINVDMLDIVSITYSGDSVDSYMDIQVGRGPFAAPVNGLVKIGDTLTAVIYVLGTDDFDVHVKSCIAHAGDVTKAIQLTDERGCVIKKKLMGPWQKTRSTGNSGASIIAYTFFQAFKFPDTMELYLECNVEICKFQCEDFCPEYPQSLTARQKRETSGRDQRVYKDKDGIVRTSKRVEPVRLLRGIQVVAPEDITFTETNNGTLTLTAGHQANVKGDFCISTPSFIAALVVILIILLTSCLMTAILCVRIRNTLSTPSLSNLHAYSQRDIISGLEK
ncbi:uncharacterized protein LOC143238378 [Tachypleus tridentatus]|uniref:uncharacterized protein LOC143238378 n=1 Tax=Tachypleus tridentatus TaxID=6853 RepID=UPI003FD47BD9